MASAQTAKGVASTGGRVADRGGPDGHACAAGHAPLPLPPFHARHPHHLPPPLPHLRPPDMVSLCASAGGWGTAASSTARTRLPHHGCPAGPPRPTAAATAATPRDGPPDRHR